MDRYDIRRKLNKEPIELSAPSDCPAIHKCCKAWYAAYQSAEDRGFNQVSTWLRANEAYRNAMPPLTTPENIRDYIACLNHGMIINAITHPFSGRLLSAAKLAASFSLEMAKLSRPVAAGCCRAKKDTPPPSPRAQLPAPPPVSLPLLPNPDSVDVS